MPPLLSALFFKRPYGVPPSQRLSSPRTMAMAAPPSTRPYDECEYLPARSPVALDANTLSPAVTITLTSGCRTQDVTRHIVLHPDEPVIIGRTSRSELKNLTSSNDNALFDCPVVSRTHAEFSLGFNKLDVKDMYKIYITDKKSMHGTSVNGLKLQPYTPFLLNVGDVIRLGNSVLQGSSKHPLARRVTSRANNVPDSYDGVIISLDCVSVASQKKNFPQTTYGARGIARGFGCPSGSDPESDDDSVEEVEAPSSAQTTPDQPKLGSSTLTGIVLDDENEREIVARAPIITARSIVVPDTYDEDELDEDELDEDELADIEAAEMERVTCLQQLEDAAADEQEEMDEEDDEEVYGAQESDLHFSDDDQSQASDDDNTSDAASSHHSFDSESDRLSDRMSDFQDDEDETEWAEQNDLHSIHDDQDDDDEDDEGPETMTSKRTQSVEIGTLGNTHGDHDEYQPSDVPPCEPAAPTRPHYDPVRGMFQVAAAPFADNPSFSDNARPARSYDLFPPPSYSGVYANAWDNSSKWDVGPSDMTSTSNWHAEAFETSTHGEHDVPSLSAWGYDCKYQPVYTVYGKNDAPNISPTVCGSGKKRKASEISTGFVPMATAPEFQPPSAKDQQSQHPSSAPSEAEQHQLRMDSPLAFTATDEALTVEPSPKKLKTCQPRTKKSMLRAAALEASKYTAGAIIGSIGLVTILVSPIGEALASC
jgi:pSer/pThr/pTyr-binding forkhead associated (FHA) protein